jgi:hypothetical protein
MLKAVLRKGGIVPLEPLPPEWAEGTVLEVERETPVQLDIDAWAHTVSELCSDSTAEDEAAMRNTIEEHRRQAKEQSRHAG